MTEDQKVAAINAAVKQNPELQALVQRIITQDPTGVTSPFDNPEAILGQKLQAMGIELPKDWQVNGNGQVAQQNWFKRNMDWVVPSLILGGGLGAGVLATGATAAPEIGLSSSAIPTAGMTAPGVVGATSGTAATTAGVAGAGGTTLASLAAKLAPYVGEAAATAIASQQLKGANDQANQYLQQATQQGLGINQGVHDEALQAAGQARDAGTAAYQPFQQVGVQGAQTLAQLAGVNRPDLAQRPDFVLPTQADVLATPGYQFALDQGLKGENATAAAKGGLLTGGAIKAAARYATDYANTKYADRVNQALQAYQTNANNDLNVYNANTANFDRPFQRAQTLAQLGLSGASGVSNAANNYANQVINSGTAYGNNATNLLTAGANANAANTQANGRSNANTLLTLANLAQDYFANQGRY